MSRSLCKPVLLLIGLACPQASGILWAQSYGTISTVAGNGLRGFSGDFEPAIQASLFNPADVAIHPNGDLYIADTYNHRIRKVDKSGIITTVAGSGRFTNVGDDANDNIPAVSAELNHPSGIAFDAAGNLYIADTDHDRIRRVDGVTGIITTVAGAGVRGYNGDNQQATLARINSPYHIALDGLGNLFIADEGNHRVRRVDANTGIITTVAGTGNSGYNGDDQPAASADLQNPRGVVTDAAGNLYIADYGNHRVRVVDPAGVIRTFAGNGVYGFNGDGGPATAARLKGPSALGMDAAGNIYIADSQDHRIRQVKIHTNIINTVAGNGQSGYSGDGGPAEEAAIASATFDAKDRMYIAQYDVVISANPLGVPTSIAFAGGSPQTTAVHTAFGQPLAALVRDSSGIPVPGVSVTFSGPSSGASASFSPNPAITDATGYARVNATANTVVGGAYLVLAEVPSLPNRAAGFDLTNTAGAAATIQFSQQPTDTSAGAFIAPPVKISLKDAYNNPVAGAQVSVGTTGLTSGGGFQNTDSSGVATYASLKFEEAGTYRLSASGPNTATSSNSFKINPGSASSMLNWSGGDQNAIVGTSYAAPLQAYVYDTFSNPVAGVAVTFTAPNSGPSVTFSGSATVTTNSLGIATSPGMNANGQTGSFSVTGTAVGIASSASFGLRNVAAPASKVAFVQQPTNTVAGAPMTPAVTVQLQDSAGNSVSTPGIAVTLQANPPLGFAATQQNTNASGLATFAGITFTKPGQFVLLAEANNVTSATSSSFTIRAGAPAKISATGGTPQSTIIQTTFAQQLQAKVLDSYDNPVSGATVIFAVAPSSSGASASLSAPAVTDASGQTSVTATANSAAGSYLVIAGLAGVPAKASFSLTNLTGSVGHVAFMQQPSNTAAGASISPSVTVQVTDAGSNPVSGASVTIHVQGGTPALGGALPATTNDSGVATFSNLSITVAGSYRLEAVSSGMSAVSNPFQISAASSPIAIVAFEGDGQSAAAGSVYSGLLKARVEDLYHNPVAGASVTFAAPASGASVTFSVVPATVITGADGVATSPAMTANSQTGTFQVTATTAAASGPALFNLTNMPGSASKLVFVQQPVDTPAGATIPPVTVQVQDSAGNAVHTGGIMVTLQANALAQQLKQLSGSATQSTDANGLATFAGLSISQAGNYALQASASGLSSATSNPFKITAGTAATIQATGGTPQSTTVLTPFAQQLQVTVLDSLNNPVSGATVTFAAPGSGASATLSAPTAPTDANGMAAVTATANSVAGSYSVTATVGAAATTFLLTNVTGSAGQISFVQQPSPTPAGNAISPPVTARLADTGGNPVSGAAVTIRLQEATAQLGGTLSGTTDAAGLATFADLSISTAGTYHLIVASGSISAPSNPFQISAAASAVVILAFEGDGQSTAVGTNYGGLLKAKVEDLYHNPIANAPVTFTAPASGASVTFSVVPATVTSGPDGLATAPAMTANSQTGTFQVTATTAATSGPAAFNLMNVPGTANKLAFVRQPVDTPAGATIPAVTVQVQDSAGNPVHTPGIMVTLQANATVRQLRQLSGTATQPTDDSGLATFASLSISQAGNYTLQASASGFSSATSNSFRITTGTAAAIQATGGTPQSALIQTPFAQQLQATVLDAFNNPVSGVTVTFTAPASGASATLSATSPQTDSNGHATVTATANGVAGTYSITAASAGASGNAAFALSNLAGSIGQIVFVQHPSNSQAGAVISPPVTVRATDAGSNPVNGATITIGIQGGAATLGGTLTTNTDASGVATFADLRINTAGSYQLIAVNGSMSAVSNLFQVSSSASSAVISVFEGDGQSAAVGGPYGGPLKAKVQDLYGNPLPGATVTFAAPASGASATFAGPATVTTGADGIATSPGITANSQTGKFQVTATTPGSTTPAVFNLTNVAGSANMLAFVQQPSDTATGAAINPPVTVQLRDSAGNAVHMAGVPVALQANVAAQRQLAGGTQQTTDANGLATFANLSTSQAGTYTLQATASGLASATSNPFKISAGIPTSILATGGTPQSALVQTAFGVPLQVTITDAYGNPISGVTVVFAAPTAGPSGLFGGQSTISVSTDAQGRASAVITANSTPGSYGVTASSAAVTGSAVFALTNLPPASSALVFVQQPANTTAGQVIAPPITVQVVDGAGRPVSVLGLPVIMSLATGTGTLSGSVVQLTEANGIATFRDLRISQTGSKQLRAAAQQQFPADSNTFQITAGPPANIAVYSGTPQSTPVGQPFPEPLQARVTDILGYPVSGVSVLFTAPATGPGGTFNGPAAVATGENGIAASPTLLANSEAGNFVATATVTGVGGPAPFALTNLPRQSTAIVATPANLSFVHEIGQAPPPGQTVQITTTSQAPVNWTASPSDSWLAAVPAGGTTPGQFVVSVNPAGLSAGVYSGSIRVATQSGGVATVLVSYTITSKPTLVIDPAVLAFAATGNALPATRNLQATSSSRPIAYTVSIQVSTPPGGTWLKASPDKGQTAGTVAVTADPAGLAQGIYNGSVLFTPTESGINSVSVPVTLVVGCGQGGCILQPVITAVVNGASFHPTGAPGAIMTILGTNFSDAVYDGSTTYPLPTVLGRTSVSVDGFQAPLYYVSPTQINFQMPSTVLLSGGNVVVNNGAPTLRASSSHPAALASVDPGIFVTPDKRASALNGDLSLHTPATPIPAGGYVVLYLTGQGAVTPAVADGAAAPAEPLSIINESVTVTIGSKNAEVTFKGLAPGFAGLAQLNVIVPAGLAPGDQPVSVSINGDPSNAGLITVK